MFVLLGSNGQITSQLAAMLLASSLPVRVIGRTAESLAPLARAGAEVAIGDPRDADFLARAFQGAAAVYTMLPPCYAEPDMRAAQDRIGEAIVTALARVAVPRVVHLSSIGAELPQGTGPIEALHAQEQRLETLQGVNLLHLRPGSFMENLLPAAEVVAAAGMLPGMEAPDAPIPMVATRDIAAVAARELTRPAHRGVLLLHAKRHTSMNQTAAALAAAIGAPGLRYVQSPAAACKAALRAHGFSANAADHMEALAHWLSTSSLASATDAPVQIQPTTIEVFARDVFAPVYARLAARAA